MLELNVLDEIKRHSTAHNFETWRYLHLWSTQFRDDHNGKTIFLGYVDSVFSNKYSEASKQVMEVLSRYDQNMVAFVLDEAALDLTALCLKSEKTPEEVSSRSERS